MLLCPPLLHHRHRVLSVPSAIADKPSQTPSHVVDMSPWNMAPLKLVLRPAGALQFGLSSTE